MSKVIAIVNQKGGVGKCLHPQTPILTNPSEVQTIEDLFNKSVRKAKLALVDKDEVYIKLNKPIKVFTLDQNWQIKSVPVSQIYRGKTNQLLEISTCTGKNIKVTPVHPLLVCRDGGLEWIKAEELNEQDFVATPRNTQLPIVYSDDLLSYYSDQIFVKVLQSEKKRVRRNCLEILSCTPLSDYQVLREIALRPGVTKQELSKLFPTTHLHRIFKKFLLLGIIERRQDQGRKFKYFLDNSDKLVDWLIKEGFSIAAAQQGFICRDSIEEIYYINRFHHKAKAIKPLLKLTPQLARFVALVLGEGSVDPARIVFYNSSQVLIKEFLQFFKILDLPITKENLGNQWKITISGAGTLAKIFYDLFELNPRGLRKSSRVRLPNCILGAPQAMLAFYLGAYIDAEGYFVKSGRSTLEISSASKENIVRLNYAFLRFGLVSQIQSKLKQASNSPTPKPRIYHTLVVSGADQMRVLQALIPLKHKKKIRLLKEIVVRETNTNIDVVPIKSLLKKARQQAGLQQKSLGSQGSISDYERGRSLPSPWALKKIVAKIYSKTSIHSTALENLKKLANSQIFWDKIKQIKKITYDGYVYDITVPEGHNFIAGEGALIAHNTTTAVNLSAYLAHLGKFVLLVDMDPQGNATSGFGINHRQLDKGIYESLMGIHEFRDVVIPTSIEGHKLAPATLDLAGANIELVNVDNREYKLREILDGSLYAYDYIIIDCPPSLGLITINALAAADQLLIPVQTEYYALEGLSQLLNTIDLVKQNIHPDLEVIGALMTMFDERYKLSHEVFHELYRYFPNKILRTVIPRNVELAEAPSYGQTILEYRPRSRGAKAYKRLAKEMLYNHN